MKKRVNGWFVYSGYFWSESTHFLVDRFTEEFAKLGSPLKILKSNEITFYINNEGELINVQNFDKPDFVIFWDKDLPLAQSLEMWGVRIYNNSKAIEVCDSKILTHLTLAEHSINMPKTIFAPLVFTTCTETNDVFLNNLLKVIGFPIVIKESSGSFGQQVYLAHDLDELRAIRKKLLYIPHLYQEFISSSAGKDVRVIILNGKVIASMLRHNEHDFRSNIELGGDNEKVELTKEFSDIALNAAKIIGLEFCGIDLLFGKNGQPILCEVNSNAYFKGIMQSTGINVVKMYAEYILAQTK